MNRKILTHPSLQFSKDIFTICKPLHKLNITYFAHVRVNNNGEFAGISNNPYFSEHYLKNKYYNADIHLAATHHGQSIMWDAIERRGKSLKMHQEAAAFGVQHTFTVIEKQNEITDCYHFANHLSCRSINQTYINHLDLLKVFISYFKESIASSSHLSAAFDTKFTINNHAHYHTQNFSSCEIQKQRLRFTHEIISHSPNHFGNKDAIASYLVTAPQQMKCLLLLTEGLSAKQIAGKLNLSTRTIENYLALLRKKFHCRSSKELIAKYYLLFGASQDTCYFLP